MPTPLLPSLKESNKIAITKRGEWMSDAQTNLGNLADDLKVTAGLNSDISSIPDLWARPSMYELVLYDENHHLHERFLAEWRGILAILALREMRTLPGVSVQNIEVPAETKIQDNAPLFLRVIAKNLPEEYKQFTDKTVEHGHKIQVISYDKAPLAIVWPTILICPSVELRANLIKPVSWWKVDGINDPISSLNEQEKSVLFDWIEMVKSDINKDGMALKNKKISNLIGLLDAFQKDLHISGISNNQYIAGTALDITGFCECLGRANMINVGESSFLAKSNVMLIDRRHNKDSKNKPKSLLVMTRDMYTQWNMSASDIIVGGAYSLDAVLPKYTGVIVDKTKIGKFDLNQFNAELCMGEEFFTEKICVVYSEDDIFPNALKNSVKSYNGAKVNIILPIKEILLDYLDEEYIATHVDIEVKDSTIEVELKLPLKGFSQEGKQLVIKKVYRQSNGNDGVDDICELNYIPMIQIWPNVILEKASNWKAYYSYYDDLNRPTFYAKPYWKAAEVQKLQTDGNVEIAKGEHFPTAYICSVDLDTENGLLTYPVGIILLNLPKIVRPIPNKKAKIGIDFGTTNSVAYMAIYGNEPKPIKLHTFNNENEKESMLYNVTINDDPFNREHGRRNFIAMSDQPQYPATSIRTIFHTYNGTNVKTDVPLMYGNIYYLDDGNSVLKDRKILSSLQTDEMKWGTPSGVKNMGSFILELGMQCMVEAVKEGVIDIEWAYSYPTSFSRSKVSNFYTIWQNNLKIFNNICPLVNNNTLNKNTESVAMATFFANPTGMGAKLNRGFICLDIGGGSTDIAVWKGETHSTNDVRYQSSLRFAGKDILNKQLYYNKDVLKALRSDDTEFNKHIDALMNESNEKEFNLLLEAFLKYYEKEIFQSLASLIELSNVNELRRNIVFSLAGIFFYSGIVIGKLRVTGKYYDNEHDDSNLLPNCYVGGNGSKLLDWATGGIFDRDHPINSIFKDCLMDGVDIGHDFRNRMDNNLPINKIATYGYDVEFDIQRTSRPKEEVAYGLVCDSMIDNSSSTLKGGMTSKKRGAIDSLPNGSAEELQFGNQIIAGEDFILDSIPKRGVEGISAEDFLKNLKVDKEFRIFNKFLETFNEQAVALELTRVVLDKRDIHNIWASVNEELNDKKRKSDGSANTIEAEPLFIMILKNTLNSICKRS